MASSGSLTVAGATLFYKVRGRGPILLVLQGGGGNADTSDGLATYLDDQFTFVSYDRRGLLRSPVDDPKKPLTIEQHTEDVSALVAQVTDGPVFVFATSFGALIGLEFLARWPERVIALVAHEPPAIEFLSQEGLATYAALRAEVLDTALRKGSRSALRCQLKGMGIERDDREDDAEPPASAREQSKQTGFLLAREARAIEQYRVNLELLRDSADKVIPALGASSRGYYPAQCVLGLAAALNRAPVEFPGGHTGYVLRPQAFARELGYELGLRYPSLAASMANPPGNARTEDIAGKFTP